ncbi:MAG: hypothetical protein JWP11_2844 [Frankiales bacterium]|nr:hypothetical protein [Frankiales bacterium]
MADTATGSWVVHRAGPISDAGLQSCTRCRAVIVDYQGAHPKPFGYPKRAQVARLDGDDGVFVVAQFTGELQPDMRLCTEAA